GCLILRALLDRRVERFSGPRRTPNWRVRLLHRLRHGRSQGKTPVPAPVFVVALPQCFQDGKHLPHEGATLRLRNTTRHAIELKLIRTAADPELQPSVAQNVTQGGLPRDPYRMPVGGHHDGSTEPDGFGMGGPVAEDREWVGGDGKLDRVVLGRP